MVISCFVIFFVNCMASYTRFVFCECFCKTYHEIRNTHYTFFHISCEFRVLLMPRKSKPRNTSTFRVNANHGAKCCKVQKAKKGGETRKKLCKIPDYTLFIFAFRNRFRVLCDKCITGLPFLVICQRFRTNHSKCTAGLKPF